MRFRLLGKRLLFALLFFPSVLFAKIPEVTKLDLIVESTSKAVGSVCYYGRCNQLNDILIGIVDKDGYTIRAYRNGRPNSELPKGKFGIASLSKAFTGLLIQLLVDEKKIDLDEPITTYLPKLKKDVSIPTFEKTQITVRHLLTHTSGLPPVIEPPGGIENPSDITWHIRVRNQLSTEEIYEYLRSLKLTRTPGTKYIYSNLGYALLTLAITTVEKAPYETVLKKRILDPLGMRDTATRVLDRSMLSSYGPTGTKISAKRMYYRQGFDTPHEGAGAIKTTVADMLKYMAAQLDLPIFGPIPRNIVDAMKKSRAGNVFVQDKTKNEEANYGIYPALQSTAENFLNLTDGYYYGFGWDHLPNSHRFTHSGSVIGYRSRIIIDIEPEARGVYVLSNNEFSDYSAASSIAKRIANLASYCVDAEHWENGKPPASKCQQ